MRAQRSDGGFTLIELLVIVVITGVLAAIVVLAVNGLPQQGEDTAEAADVKLLRDAEEAYLATRVAPDPRVYASEDRLVEAKLLAGPSRLHDICLRGDNLAYKVVPAGTNCATVTF